MSIDWKLLIDVRERRKKIALEAMLVNRRAAERSRSEAQQAQAQWQRRVDAKLDFWQATRLATAGGSFSVSQLSDAAGWSGALDAQIAQQSVTVQQAQCAFRECEQMLEASRGRLCHAAGGVEKAERMHKRDKAMLRRVDEARFDAAIEGSTSTAWAARRAS
jgi:hypothetical protein